MRYGRRHGRPAGPPPRGVSIHVTAPGRIFSVTALCAARWLRRRLRLRRLTQPDGQARPPSPVAAATDAAACTRLVAAAAALDAGRRLVRRGCTGVGGKEMPGLVRAEWGIRDGRRQQHAGLPMGHRQRREGGGYGGFGDGAERGRFAPHDAWPGPGVSRTGTAHRRETVPREAGPGRCKGQQAAASWPSSRLTGLGARPAAARPPK